jgi:hypothetical protein
MDRNESEYPVSNDIYNMIMMLASKLEAVDVYQEYAQDMEGSDAECLRRIEADDRQHIELLIDQIENAIRERGLRPGGRRGGGSR